MIRFSARTGWNLEANAIRGHVEEARAAGRSIVDLTETNPTRVGLAAPKLVEPLLARAGTMTYAPEPFGLRPAREAAARDLQARGIAAHPDRTFLSASTSEAYAWLFKLLCDPGDEVLVPAPSYPLFSYLAEVEAVHVRPYPLVREEAFAIDLDRLAGAITPRTRAIVVVHPNNPTGTLVAERDARGLDRLAAERGLAIMSDEVFRGYVFSPAAGRRRTFAADREALTFVLDGLSKSCCAPGLKLAFTTVHGPPAEVAGALARLEVIADTFLSVGTPVQLALADILALRSRIEAELGARLVANVAAIDRAVERTGGRGGVRRLAADGGWSSVLEVARTLDEGAWVKRLVDEAGALVHPGYFFEFDREGFLVVSLILDPAVFAPAIDRVVDVCADA